MQGGRFEEWVRALERPEAYPEDPSARERLEHVQTHLSHVFLTGRRVYKLRKPVNLGFVDFSTRVARNADCLREVHLNRRLAPDVYLGVAPLLEAPSGVRVGPLSETLAGDDGDTVPEHCVVMRRLPEGRDALSLLSRRALRPEHLDRVAHCVARFHAAHRLGAPAPFTPEGWLAHVSGPVEATLESLRESLKEPLARRRLERLAARARDFLRRQRARFEARRVAGRVVDGHGDLHLQHVWFERDDSPPLLIDCIEFRDDLRRIDAAADVAFLAMDLVYRRRERLAERFLRRYAEQADDFDLYGVLAYYQSYRAAVRAKVAAIAASEPELPEAQRRAATPSARRHLALALRFLEHPGRGALVLVSGLVGVGKSTVAERLADGVPGVVIASDRVRKRMAGIDPTERSDRALAAELYTPERTQAVYRGLLERAEPVLASGRVAILDATYARKSQREAARRFALQQGVPFRLVEVRCAPATALERLARRVARGGDPSDAGPELYPRMRAGFEPIDEIPAEEHRVLHSDARAWRSAVRQLARELRALRRAVPASAPPPGPYVAKEQR